MVYMHSTEVDDQELIGRIATQRDPVAFEEIYRRYQRPLLALCNRLTADHALAEEAFQEGLLQIWRSSDTHQPGRPVDRWLFCVVARQAIKIAKKNRRMAPHACKAENLAVPGSMDSLAAASDRSELAALLLAAVAELRPTERQLLALHFMAGLSQREIGRLLHLPQRTISSHLKRVLDHLRGKVPAFRASACTLEAILSQGAAWGNCSEQTHVPPWIWDKVRTRIEAVDSAPSPFKREEASRLRGPSWLFVGAFASLGLVGSLAIWAWATGKGSEPWTRHGLSTRNAKGTSESPAIPEPSDPRRPFRAFWDFDRADQLTDFQIRSGQIRHLPDAGIAKSGALCLEPGGSMRLHLPERMPSIKVNYRWRCKGYLQAPTDYVGLEGISINWEASRVDGMFNGLLGPPSGELDLPAGWSALTGYLAERTVDLLAPIPGPGRRTLRIVIVAEGGAVGQDLYFRCGNTPCFLDELAIEECPPATMPNVADFRAAHARLSSEAPPGQWLEVPWLRRHAAWPGEEVRYLRCIPAAGTRDPAASEIRKP